MTETVTGDDVLVASYRTAADAHAEAIKNGDHVTANHAAGRIAAIYSELRRRGIAHQSKLLPLLSDDSPGVRDVGTTESLQEPYWIQRGNDPQGLARRRAAVPVLKIVQLSLPKTSFHADSAVSAVQTAEDGA